MLRLRLCFASAAVAAGDSPVVIDVPGVAPLQCTLGSDGIIRALGVPFAEPPIGDLRFAKPQPWKPRSLSPALNATSFGPTCPQYASPPTPFYPQSEDCLTLNVWAPPQNTTKNTTKLLPVFFWIHGGGFQVGSGREYNPTKLAQRGLVVVTINYRLGALGWFRSGDASAIGNGGMHGFLDQVLALTWVRDHISAFGGDPQQVTLAGESAGGLSVCTHAFLKVSQGLFRRAVIQSGSCMGPWGYFEADLSSKTFAGSRSVAALRSLPLATLMNNPMQWSGVMPSPDGINLVGDESLSTFLSDSLLARNIDLIIGFNSLDSLFGYPWIEETKKSGWDYHPKTVQDYEAWLTDGFGDEGLKIYPTPQNASADNLARAWTIANGDICNACPSHWLAQKAAAVGNKVFMYFFEYAPSNNLYRGLACHECELPYVYQDPASFLRLTGSENYSETLGNKISGYWASFTLQGQPEANGSAAWPSYTGQDIAMASYLNIGQDASGNPVLAASRGARAQQCNAITKYVFASDENMERAFTFCYGIPQSATAMVSTAAPLGLTATAAGGMPASACLPMILGILTSVGA